jgi:hypothetical protein
MTVTVMVSVTVTVTVSFISEHEYIRSCTGQSHQHHEMCDWADVVRDDNRITRSTVSGST